MASAEAMDMSSTNDDSNNNSNNMILTIDPSVVSSRIRQSASLQKAAAASNNNINNNDHDMNAGEEQEQEQPHFPKLSAVQASAGNQVEYRRIRCPPHRYTPLREHWEQILTPLVEYLQLQVRAYNNFVLPRKFHSLLKSKPERERERVRER
jgi:hypothetical protein